MKTAWQSVPHAEWCPRRPQRPAAVVLVLVLWALVILTVLVLGVARNTRLDNAIRVAAGDRVRARWLARAGVAQALAALAADAGPTDATHDPWYDNSPWFHNHALPDGSFTVRADRPDSGDPTGLFGLVDEASRLNVNTASRDALLALPHMTPELADAILAARTRLPTPDSPAPAVAPTQQPPRRKFHTIRELALVDGMTQQLLFGEDTNLNGILDNNENDGDALPPDDNRDGRLDQGLLAYVTVYSYERNVDGQGRPRLNINTATQAELEEQLGLLVNYAKWIVQHRVSGYQTIADIVDRSSLFAAPLSAPVSPVTPAPTLTPAPTPTPRASAVPQAAPPSPAAVAPPTTAPPPTTAAPPAAPAPPPAEPPKAAPLQPTVAVFRAIADRITVTDAAIIPGRININTAGPVVLSTLPGLTSQLAQRIVAYRQRLPAGFTSVAELLSVPGITVSQLRLFVEMITVRSNVFTVRSRGAARRTGLHHTVEAVVERRPAGLDVLYWHERGS